MVNIHSVVLTTFLTNRSKFHVTTILEWYLVVWQF